MQIYRTDKKMTEDNLYLLFCYLIYGLTLVFLTMKSKNRIRVLSINTAIMTIYSSYFLYNLNYNSQYGSSLLWFVGLMTSIGFHWILNIIKLCIIMHKGRNMKSKINLLSMIFILSILTS